MTITITPTAARAASLYDAATARLEVNPYLAGGMVFKFCAIDAVLAEPGVLGARWRVAAKKESSLFATPERTRRRWMDSTSWPTSAQRSWRFQGDRLGDGQPGAREGGTWPHNARGHSQLKTISRC
jgi:hypothetical protein